MKYVRSSSCLVAALLAASGSAMGQAPTIDGTRDAVYGAPLWVNTQNPTGFGDNVPGDFPCDDFGSGINLAINNSNIVGVPGSGAPVCAASGAGVTTGFEIKIPFAAIGNPTDATFQIAGFVIGSDHGFISNQVIGHTPGGAVPCLTNLGEPRAVIFSDSTGGIAGNQFITVTNGADVVAAGPTIDGTLDASFWPAIPLWVNTTETQFGDNITGSAGQAGGSEIDAVFARVATVNGEKSLYIFITGNLESNFNKVWVFLDTVAGQGQNRLRGDNANLDFNGLNRLGDDTGSNGLTFDDSFDADYALTFTNGGNPVTTFANFGELLTTGGGRGRFVGQAQNPAPIIVAPCVPQPLPVPSPDKAYGSEFDAVYGVVCDNFLYVFIAGNLEVNGNRIDLFFDVGTGPAPAFDPGQQTLRIDNVNVDFDGLNRMGGPEAQGSGLTFDAGFAADYWLSFRNTGAATADPVEMASHAAFLRSGGAAGDDTDPQGLLDYGAFVSVQKATVNPLRYDGTTCIRFNDVTMACEPNGFGTSRNPMSLPGFDVQKDLMDGSSPIAVAVPEIFTSYAPRLISARPFDPLGTLGGGSLLFPDLIRATINNNNTAGVTNSTATGGELVTTGYEVTIRLDELGWDGVSPIRVAGFINSQNRDFISNQVIGGLPAGAGNIGEPRAVDFSDPLFYPGDQFVTVPLGTCVVASTGACCSGATCSPTTLAACTGPNTSFAGVGTTCNAFPSNLTPCCFADFNHLGGITVQDIFDFLTAYFSSNPQSNINGAGGITVQDIFDFLGAYFAGGC